VKRAGVEVVAGGKPPIEAVYGYATKAHLDLSPALAQAAEEALAEEVTGMLCLLYVAMTRARASLYLLVPPRRINKDGKPGALSLTPAAILRNALGGGPEDSRQGPQWTTLFEAGTLGESILETARGERSRP
jgi:ATP-dependent exoDNAse (exonuclease V) beta subunit